MTILTGNLVDVISINRWENAYTFENNTNSQRQRQHKYQWEWHRWYIHCWAGIPSHDDRWVPFNIRGSRSMQYLLNIRGSCSLQYPSIEFSTISEGRVLYNIRGSSSLQYPRVVFPSIDEGRVPYNILGSCSLQYPRVFVSKSEDSLQTLRWTPNETEFSAIIELSGNFRSADWQSRQLNEYFGALLYWWAAGNAKHLCDEARACIGVHEETQFTGLWLLVHVGGRTNLINDAKDSDCIINMYICIYIHAHLWGCLWWRVRMSCVLFS